MSVCHKSFGFRPPRGGWLGQAVHHLDDKLSDELRLLAPPYHIELFIIKSARFTRLAKGNGPNLYKNWVTPSFCGLFSWLARSLVRSRHLYCL